ncbi:MAG: DEAD/DEAH box helicase [Thermoplasmata archaeon]
MSVFGLLTEPLRQLLDASGLKEPTEPQELGIPAILLGENVLLLAPTGLGKTEAAVLPVLDRIVRERPPPPSLIYITPLRALNRDLLRRLGDWGRALGVSIGVRHGDTPQRERAEQVRRPPDIFITTPETLQIMLGAPRIRALLKNVRWVVVDEIHELAGDERGWQLAVGLERLVRLAGREVQRIGLSATVGNAEQVAEFLAGVGRRAKVLRVPVGKSMEITVECPPVTEEDSREAERLRCDGRTLATLRRCSSLIEGGSGVLLFTNTRDSAEVLASRLRLWRPELPLGVHHGSLYRDVRVQMEEEFKAGGLRALICTSSLELGIDIGGVELTLQYGSPRQATRLVQRVGRSGHRKGLVSRGVVLAQDADDIAESAVLARRAIAEEVEPVRMRPVPLGVLANQLVALAMGCREVSTDEAYDTLRRSHPFRVLDRETFDRVLEQLVSLGVLWSDGLRGEGGEKGVGEKNGEEGCRGGHGGAGERAPPRSPERYGSRRGTIKFFYENLSMIPDEKTYSVIDITTRRAIGTLDEFFVLTYGEVGVRFVMRGSSWRIVELGEDRVLVEPSPELGAIPGWLGEEIPVPFEVAQEVGRLRARIAEMLEAGGGRTTTGASTAREPAPEGREDPSADGKEGGPARAGPKCPIPHGYPMNEDAWRELVEFVTRQRERGLPVPTDRLVTVEAHRAGRLIVVNACFGTRVNDTLARLLSALLSTRLGAEIGIQTDPYRIALELPAPVRPETVVEQLRRLGPGDAERILKLAVGGSSLLRRELLHTARRFGAVEKGADLQEIRFDRVMKLFKGTPLYEEAVEKTLFERMDIEGMERVLERIRNGDIELLTSPPSPIGEAGVRQRWETMAAGRVERPILLAFKTRLERASLRLVCLACGGTHRGVIKELPPKIQCPYCSGQMVAAVPLWETGSVELVERVARLRRGAGPEGKKQGGRAGRDGKRPAMAGGAGRRATEISMSEEEKKTLMRLRKCASLVLAHGKRALLALAARGVGVDTAARILAFQHETEEEFLRALLAAEVQYARNRRFW